MNQYRVDFDKDAQKQMKTLKKSGRKIDMERVNRFILEVRGHPRHGIGHPKPIRHKIVETWARKVNDGDRFVYEIHEEDRLVFVTQVLGHYEDR